MGKNKISVFLALFAVLALVVACGQPGPDQTDQRSNARGTTGDGVNDPDTLGDPEDNGLGDGDTQSNVRSTAGNNTNNTSTGRAMQTGSTATRTTTGSTAGDTTNDSRSTTTTTGRTTTGTTVSDDQDRDTTADATRSNARMVADQQVQEMGNYEFVGSERYDVSEQITVYMYQLADDMRSSARATANDMIYVIVADNEVVAVIEGDRMRIHESVFVQDGRSDVRGDADGFVEVERNIETTTSTTRMSARSTTLDDNENETDTNTTSAPWNRIGTSNDEDTRSSARSTSVDDTEDDVDEQNEDDTASDSNDDSSAPWNRVY